ncbi:MAG: efflux RND transporter permease subunit [Nitrosospira sp.]|nr:efflux RND transporter permease subunit [Nitrosospira sp.]MBI0414599.1 efflux RND transporter permease subunit [Nitrosospira sp.]MBI0417277.1 efflux RND transporter permease subunit [Nitrosospira sp.]MBI0419569.1 efflux RND transporter permease subunit [Nitrosospira sp.]
MIEKIVKGSLQERLIVVVLAIVLLFAGFFGVKKLSVDAFPDVTSIQVQIATPAPGKSPEEIERFITIPIEIAMTGLPGLVDMRSLNKTSLSLITLVFTDTTNVYFARQLVTERLIGVIEKMPDGIMPALGPVSTGLGEIFQYILEKPGEENKKISEEELTERRTIQDWVVRPMLRNLSGVAEINSYGGFIKQYQVLVDADRLHHYGLKLQDVYVALSKNNTNSGAGVLPQFDEQYLIRGVGLIKNLDDIRLIVLKEHNSTPVYMRNVADVKLGHEVRVGSLVKNGDTEAVGAIVMMVKGGNAKEIVTHIKTKIDEINKKNLLPGGLQIRPFYDRSQFVDSALFTVVKVLIESAILVIIILLLFLGDVRSSLIVMMTLILTPLATFIVMNYLGISANLMSLGGLTIAIGLMLDGSVVVVENIFHRLGHDTSNSKLRVILDSTIEVGKPVLFGVGIIILVFIPLMTLTGMEGKMFSPLVVTIAIALFISLILSFTLIPVLCSYFLKRGSGEDTKIIQVIKAPYIKLLNLSLNNELKTILIAAVVFISSVAILPFLGTSFIPEMKEGTLVASITRMPNISLDASIDMERKITKEIVSVPGVLEVLSNIGRGESPADSQSQNESQAVISLKDKNQWPKDSTQDTISQEIQNKLKNLLGAQVVMMQPISSRVAELSTGVRADVAVKLFGEDISLLKAKADDIAKLARNIKGAADIKIEKVSGQSYLNINIDRQAIARYGFNVSDINEFIETAIGGKIVTRIFEGQKSFSASIRFPEDQRDNSEAIKNILLTSPNGSKIALKDLALIETKDGPAQISREYAKRRIAVAMNVKDRDLGSFVAELQKKLDSKIKLPDGYYFVYGGQFENMQRALNHLAVIVPVTILGIFFLLFILFNSIRYATMIITVVPFAMIGGIFGLAITGEYLSVPASVGFIALCGIAILNGVVLITYIQQLESEGMSQLDAIREGCKQRLRPVLMTATIGFLALVPFLFATGTGSEIQKPLAIVMIGGLITSTLLTLLVLPTLYKKFDKEKINAI